MDPRARYRHQISDYVRILVENDKDIPFLDVFLAKIYCWLLLAGYITLPPVITSLHRSKVLTQVGSIGEPALHLFQKVPILVIASVLCLGSIVGLVRLWFKRRRNCVWLLNHVFLPVLGNCTVGFITTLTNVYTAHNGTWSVASVTTIAVSAAAVVASGTACVVYWLQLERLREIIPSSLSISPREAAERKPERVLEKHVRVLKKRKFQSSTEKEEKDSYAEVATVLRGGRRLVAAYGQTGHQCVFLAKLDDGENTTQLEHDHIVQLLGLYDHEGQVHAVLEFTPRTLEQICAIPRRLKERHIATISKHVGQGLEYLLANGLTTKTLPPSAVGFTSEGVAKIMYLGVFVKGGPNDSAALGPLIQYMMRSNVSGSESWSAQMTHFITNTSFMSLAEALQCKFLSNGCSSADLAVFVFHAVLKTCDFK
ncbi:hypothetical protein NKR23_g9007 [Pleurostoma richardsiae]|uniref:Protein kinase domain-containing protein n=1 Tax=Pleurostoma richardsiae TaxID=41990 RepID=A0AA38RH38_9PEZI|nr:hypothetical protein NKR23_g9007 [Pleurostoma richardsiae]